jgi:hypothetical protein
MTKVVRMVQALKLRRLELRPCRGQSCRPELKSRICMSLGTRADGTGVCCTTLPASSRYEFLVIPRSSNVFPPAATIVLPPMSFSPSVALKSTYAGWLRNTHGNGQRRRVVVITPAHETIVSVTMPASARVCPMRLRRRLRADGNLQEDSFVFLNGAYDQTVHIGRAFARLRSPKPEAARNPLSPVNGNSLPKS